MCSKVPPTNLSYLERENENLKDLLKFHEIFDGKFNTDQCTLGDFEKRILKDLIDLKDTEFSQESLKLNSSNIMHDESFNINNIEKESFDEIFDPIYDSHI